MVISVLYGSNRTDRQGIKGAKFLVNQLQHRGHQVYLIDAKEVNLPFLVKMYKEYNPEDAPQNMQNISDQLKASDGFMIVSGEWNHSIPPALKNLLDHFQSEYHYKPSAIATYSAGPFGGVRASVHLRAIMGELGMPSIPSMFAISNIGSAFNANGDDDEGTYTRRSVRFLDEFDWYLEAFKNQREKAPN